MLFVPHEMGALSHILVKADPLRTSIGDLIAVDMELYVEICPWVHMGWTVDTP
jgi:hypothetical protein